MTNWMDDMTKLETVRAIAASLALAAATALMPASALAQEITVTHARGETAVPQNPVKVLVFDLASLDTLDALGVEVAGVPSGRLPDYLERYGSGDHIKVGTLFEPDYEAVNAAEPDLIIVGGRSAAKYDDLAKFAPTIDLTVDRGNYLASVRSNAETLGRIFGKEEAVAEKLASFESSVEALRALAGDAGNGLVILTTGGRMSAHGPGSRFDLIYSDFGISPAVEGLDTGNHGQAISFEFILETNPDWLFVVDRDAAIGREGQAAKELLDNEIVGKSTAWQQDQVVYLDPVAWYLVGGGLTALQKSVDQIATAFQAD
jgi:iron complex transport system substrate-binding protein